MTERKTTEQDIATWMSQRNAEVAKPANHRPSPAAAPSRVPGSTASRRSVGHPGAAESLIPIWGAGREAVAEWQEGDELSAVINAAIAASDVFLLKAIGQGIARGALEQTPRGWRATRKWLGKQGFLKTGQHGHHWAIPQNGWGKYVPDRYKNHLLNIKGMPSPEVHGRITGPFKGKPQYNLFQQYWHGTPAWAKVAPPNVVGHGLLLADDD